MSALALIALAVWAYLAVGHGGFWRTADRLRRGADPRAWPDVAAVVPARDEAAILPETLPTLLAQEYPGRFEVILVDDDSTDGTSEVAGRLAAEAEADAGEAGRATFRAVRVTGREDGWAGKVRAMAEGVRAAGEVEFLLFTDADIAYRPGTVTRLVRAATPAANATAPAAATTGEDGLDLVSRMAMLSTRTRWERALVPAFVYFFAQLYPFRRVGEDGARTAAAAGGCMLVRRSALARAGGLAAIRGALIDDVALGRLVKRGGGRCRLDLGREVASVRPYPRLADLWAMVARSAYHQLRYSPVLLAGTVLGLLLVYVVPPVAAVVGVTELMLSGGARAATAAAAGGTAWTIMAATYAPTLRLYRLSPLRAPLLPLVALLYTGMTVDSARRHRAGRGGAWKGRTVTGR
ncbi:glycosyltransferase [Actinomadura fibrosa]|uniref:Glycosyltransferase n=1 Tax=Actinomadura fibrosa TaxID=111802 RepID=A0ABW2XE57_9ACTN|nr:glycosyltransferase [Actinomadura fibrosa]